MRVYADTRALRPPPQPQPPYRIHTVTQRPDQSAYISVAYAKLVYTAGAACSDQRGHENELMGGGGGGVTNRGTLSREKGRGVGGWRDERKASLQTAHSEWEVGMGIEN